MLFFYSLKTVYIIWFSEHVIHPPLQHNTKSKHIS